MNWACFYFHLSLQVLFDEAKYRERRGSSINLASLGSHLRALSELSDRKFPPFELGRG